jgi:hypothetical protein
MIMTKEELALKLNGREYGNEIKYIEEKRRAISEGLVMVFGGSDDLMKFEGAINDEIDCFNGGTAYFDEKGLLKNGCSDEDCPYFLEKKETAKTIEAVWHDEKEVSWTYETKIPHATFEIMRDGEVYCIGIVFSINDLKQN